ncbi:MAG TPA: hypothetical protein ENI02_01580 [Candidatus Aminicenantes bacterium]|nr:hypothetical protein [Candidatus Aminicenantes bacterium]
MIKIKLWGIDSSNPPFNYKNYLFKAETQKTRPDPILLKPTSRR